jgi:hypothetical protein
MPETKRRRWLQLHLSTCIVLMFVAGALVWANARNRFVWSPTAAPAREMLLPTSQEQDFDGVYGWPSKYYERYILRSHNMDVPAAPPTRIWHADGVCYDTATALTILFVAAVSIEFLIRRRERQQP